MKNNTSIKLFVISFLAIGLAVAWGVIFYLKIFPKETLALDKEVFSAETSTQNTSSSHSLVPLISNQWYTSITEHFPSYPLYAMPLAFQTSAQGLGFSYPDVKQTKDTIAAPYNEDFTIGFTKKFEKTRLNGVGDWTINASLLTDDNKTLSFTLGHGVPFTTIQADEPMQINFKESPTVFVNNKPIPESTTQADSFMVMSHNHYYIFTLPQKVTIQIKKNSISIDQTEKLFVGLLDKKENFDLFKENSAVTITDSLASPQITDTNLTVLYKLTAQNGTPLMTLYPHQYDLLPSKQTILGTYHTLRGELKLVKTDNFTLSFPRKTPNGSFSKLQKDYPDLTEQIKKDIQQVMKEPKPSGKDYFLGTWFGKISNLLLLADTYGLDKEKDELLQFVKPIFLDSIDKFAYDREKTSLIAEKPEFGNEDLNDHHFHYGYYIRTAAVISDLDLRFLPEVKPKIDAMVKDIAMLDRSASDYPYIRNFDTYEGHSWADGMSDTPDGTNQESSSEAINAWYSLYLWGKITNDANLQKNALYLYNMESQSIQYYWFNKNNIYGNAYDHAIASIVWGGKVDFATWFSKETNMIYGIQLLPITPASTYLGDLPSFTKYEADFRSSGGSETKEWGDLFTIWKSFYAPKAALQTKEKITKREANTPKSVFLYMLYLNEQEKQDLDTETTPTVSQ